MRFVQSALDDTGLPFAAAVAACFAKWRRTCASSTTASYMRTARAIAFYSKNPEAMLWRAARRWTGAAPTPSTTWTIAGVLRTVRAERSEAADGVLISLVCGGARYTSVTALRRGDVEVSRITLRFAKTNIYLRPTHYPIPPVGWIRSRLRQYALPTPPDPWPHREKLLRTTPALMSRLVPPRDVRRAVAVAMVKVHGMEKAAETLGNRPCTVAAHYCAAPTAGVAAWTGLLSAHL